MANVYLAEDSKHHRLVAVKVLRPELAELLGVERFLREIEIVARLDHPHILPLYDSGEADGYLYYVMPFVEGESLRGRLDREKQLPIDDALSIAREVGDALGYAHSRHVVHRDIKPENILLSGGHARVADFGIARALTQAGGDRLTQTGIALGTPAYMSPEQALGERDADGRSDIYSLGCVTYEMLSGSAPFTGPALESIVAQHIGVQPRPVSELRPGVPAHVNTALLKALAKLPADRLSTAQFTEAMRPRADGEPAAAGSWGARPGRPRHRVVAGALALLAVAVAAVYGIRGFVADKPLTGQQSRVLLADFDNRTGDSTHGTTVTELVRVGLSQSRVATILDPTQVTQILQLMQRDAREGVSKDVALEAAQRGWVNAAITGDIIQVGDNITISARLQSADGQLLTAKQETANGPNELVTAVDRLSAGLREAFGESLRTIRRSPTLEEVTTKSMEALRLYSQGLRASNQGDDPRAVQLLEESVRTDSGFAMAHRKLAIILSNRAEQRARSVEAARKAYEHRNRLTERERLIVTAAYYSVVEADRDQAISAYSTLIESYPNDYLGLNNLGSLYSQLRNYPRAAQYYQRALAVDSTTRLHYSNLAGALAQQKLFDSADAVLDRFGERFQGNPEVIVARIIGSAYRKDYDAARRMGDSLVRAQRGRMVIEAVAFEWLASLSAMRGQLRQARTQWARSLSLTGERNLGGTYLVRAARRAMTEFLLTGDVASGRRVLDEALTRYPLQELAPLDRPYPLLAMTQAAVGRVDVAKRLLAEYEKLPNADHSQDQERTTHGARAMIAIAEDRLTDATQALWLFDDGNSCSTCAASWLARVYDRAGNPDSARLLYEHFAETPSSAVWFDAGHLAHSYERLGEYYEQRGDRAKAADYFSRFIKLWENADPDLQPRVQRVREALNRVSGEPSRPRTGRVSGSGIALRP